MRRTTLQATNNPSGNLSSLEHVPHGTLSFTGSGSVWEKCQRGWRQLSDDELNDLKFIDGTAYLPTAQFEEIKKLRDALKMIADYYEREYREGDKAFQASIIARGALARS